MQINVRKAIERRLYDMQKKVREIQDNGGGGKREQLVMNRL